MAPPIPAVIVSQIVFGAIAAFVFGKDLSSSSSVLMNIQVQDLALTLIACSLFSATWTYDLMSVGVIRHKYKLWDEYINLDKSKTPHDVLVTERAAQNQIEQYPIFMLSLWLGTFLLHSQLAGAMGIVWGILRSSYTSKMRNSAGQKWIDKGLGNITVPCYMIISTLINGSVINVLRQIKLF
jgi:MAPEG family